MLNDTGGVEQVIAARVKAAWMKFRAWGNVMYARGFYEDERHCV